MNTTIYYFSATGNSLKIAQDLNNKIRNSMLIPIAREIKKNKIECLSNKAGFVFPIYMLGLPKIIHNFLNCIDLSKTDYIFTVITSGGGNINAMQQVKKKLKDKGKKLNAGFYITIGSNNVYTFSLKTEKKMKDIFTKADLKVVKIAEIINLNKNKVETGIVHMNILIRNRVNQAWLKIVSENDKKYYLDYDLCNLCGICIKVCPVDNIFLKDGKIYFHHKCEECRACIHHCPKEAIKINQKSFLRKQYIHPEISITDIINQK